MVAMPKKAWLSGVRVRLGGEAASHDGDPSGQDAHQKLGILSFEAARTMSRLVSLHRALSEPEMMKLRSETMRTEGVTYLTSVDQTFLLRLACAEMVDDLDRAADAISRIAERGRMTWTRSFHHVYACLKTGTVDSDRQLGLGFHSKEMEKKMKKMEKYVQTTSNLYEEMETLAEMEASEMKLERWKNCSGPMQPLSNPPGAELFLKKLSLQRKLVRKIQEESLWGKGYEKIINLMAKATITIFTRICTIFPSAVPDLPVVVSDRDGRVRLAPRYHQNIRNGSHPNYASGPLERPMVGNFFIGNSGPLLRPQTQKSEDSNAWASKTLEPPANTVGGSGLAIRYAEVIDLAEKMLSSPASVSQDAREELYRLLQGGLRSAVRAKLKRCWRMDCMTSDDETMAEGWRDAAERMLEWLGPMAKDTKKWHSARSCERRKFDQEATKVLMLQTLCFSDREKTEAAIVEVLVGLSFVCRYQHGGCFRRDGGREGCD